MAEGLGCKINIYDKTVKDLDPMPPSTRTHANGFATEKWRCLKELWKMSVEDPNKIIHCFKVGLALSIVSLFYYMRPLYDALGGNAMWALMTVVVVFEFTVGATLCRSVNSAVATAVAGSLGVGVHWIAGQCGKQYEPIVTGISVFLIASIATFSRFIPSVKGRFDYGAVVFILSFTFISVSGYRVDKLVMLGEGRISTIAIGASICILVNMLFCPVWAGDQLHRQTISNLEKLAYSLEGCVSEYFSENEITNISEKDLANNLQGYKSLFNSQATEESLESFAKWEPPHGHYHSGHPWKQYLKINAAARRCAYCIDNLNSCINSEIKAPEFLKTLIKEKCTHLSLASSQALKELATIIKTRTRSEDIDFAIEEMNFGAQELQNSLLSFSLPLTNDDALQNSIKTSLLDVLALGCVVTLMIENVARIEEIVIAVDKLATVAEFEIKEERRWESQAKDAIDCNQTVDKCNQEDIDVLDKV